MKSPLLSATKERIALREVLLLGLLGAVLIISQVALALIPNIELVSFLVIVYTLVLGKKAFFPIYVFVLAEGLIFGFGEWWFSYLYIWSILAAVVLLFRKNEHPVLWAVISGLFGLLFGALCAIPYIFSGGIGYALSYWARGIIFDLLHCAGNSAAMVLLFNPAYRILKKLYRHENRS